jgi:hypothetical protein
MPRLIYLRERTSGTYEVGSWMSPRAVLGILIRKKFRNGSVSVKLEVEKNPQMCIFHCLATCAVKADY